MAVFKYKARDKSGVPISGIVEAADQLAVAKNLNSLGYSVVLIEEESTLKLKLDEYWRKIFRMRKNEVIFIFRQLGTMLRSGIALSAAFAAIEEQVQDKNLKEIMANVHKDIEAGLSFSESISKYKHVFSELDVSMIRVGETAGILDDVIDRIVQLGMQDMEVRSRIKAAATYPVILVIVATIVVISLIVGVLPKFTAIFEASGAQLPMPTRILLGVSFFVSHYWYIIIIIVTVAVSQFVGYMKTEKGRYNIDYQLLKIPIIGQFYVKVIISRFARTFSALIKSGVPILEALAVVEKTISNVVVAGVIQKIRDAITAGGNVTEPFKASGIFPPMVIQMISAGEKTGKLDQMLNDVAIFYDTEIEQATRNLSTVLEPILLLVMGLMVGFIALSVLLPIFNLIKVFR